MPDYAGAGEFHSLDEKPFLQGKGPATLATSPVSFLQP
jgi:hypothetical protein